jgi:hypothetical protein
MSTKAGRNRQGKAGRDNYREVCRLLAEEKRTAYGRLPPPPAKQPAPSSAVTSAPASG